MLRSCVKQFDHKACLSHQYRLCRDNDWQLCKRRAVFQLSLLINELGQKLVSILRLRCASAGME